MKFSIFTPSHNSFKLSIPAKSLEKQLYKNFEWIILLNGESEGSTDYVKSLLSEELLERTKIFSLKDGSQNIGALKKKCCSLSTGDVLVELDHDDELESDCLLELLEAFKNKEIDFAYSDCFHVYDGQSKKPYSEYYGWKYSLDEKKNKFITHSFDPSPHAFAYIWHAPNHVRSWRKTFYWQIGGHDESLDVCDDFELLCRTYISGKCHLIKKPLYTYHVDKGQNTCYGEKNERIQNLTREFHDRYIERMVAKWCDLNNLKKVDLCSFDRRNEGYLTVDKFPYEKVDVVFDLDQPNWPFEDGSVGLFRMQDAIEHLKNPIQTMKELYRCLSDYGWALIEVPSTDGRGAFQDPTHVSFWNSNSFWYYTKKDQAQYINTPVKFQLNRLLNYFPSDYHSSHNILYTKAHLVKLKGEEIPPGGREI